MRIRWISVTTLTLALASVAPAQSVAKMLGDDISNAGKDVLAIWGSPFDATGRDWLMAGAAFSAFGLSILADQSVSDWAIRNDSSSLFRALKPVRRGGKLFAGNAVVPPVAAVYVIGVALKNQDMRDFVTGCMTSWVAQSYARKAFAYAFGRARPDTTDTRDVSPNDPHIWELGGGWGNWNMRSFPAGHFANAVSCATYWNERFSLGVAGPALYALAAAVGVGRTADQAHWFSDHIIGGILGYAVGREVARRSRERQKELRSSSAATLNVSPGPGGATVSLRWTF